MVSPWAYAFFLLHIHNTGFDGVMQKQSARKQSFRNDDSANVMHVSTMLSAAALIFYEIRGGWE